ncbi:MAG: hypothetical protein A3G08_02600 [Candidatus Magasanikbacteria bacterium RIFCSPLOWO2_12_FULL_47_9b]|nr:MAG: hypothetical protein A3G08_02600 [Candidatus Magasanikbacteria bacterium RIFCSPLOWO2_12_FULL_47_9b]
MHLVTWNGAKYIPYLFDSFKKQTFQDWQMVVLDNASEDATVGAIENELISFSYPHELIRNKENKGFAGGHNQLFRLAMNKEQDAPEYIVLLNQDMYLMPDCLEKLVVFLDREHDVAAVTPRLMKWNFCLLKEKPGISLEESFTDCIDSLGLKVFRSRRVIEKYAGKEWENIKSKMNLSFRATPFERDTILEVFGVSGALPLFRRSALEAISFSDGTFLDEQYHAYKEDVDLAFRLRLAGYRAFVELDAVAYHDRSAVGMERMSDTVAAENKKKQSSWVKHNSYKNHLMTLYKNEYWQNVVLDFPWIFWYELKKFFWFLLFDRSVLKGLGDIWRKRNALKEKRTHIRAKRKISWKAMRQWW